MTSPPGGTKYWYLKNFSFFECLTDQEFEDLARMAQMHLLPRKAFVSVHEEDVRYVYFVKRGHLKIARLVDDRELIVDVISPGEFFGELTGSATSDEMAEALDEATICVFRYDDFVQILDRNPKLNREILKQVGDRLLRFKERLVDIAFRDARSRVAGFIIRYAGELGYLTHQEIAYLTGLSRQTVTQIMNAFREEGLIDFDRTGIRVIGWKELHELSA
jgi:CRP/FNR family transcriptional regulator, cyclic AMP receptor protein